MGKILDVVADAPVSFPTEIDVAVDIPVAEVSFNPRTLIFVVSAAAVGIGGFFAFKAYMKRRALRLNEEELEEVDQKEDASVNASLDGMVAMTKVGTGRSKKGDVQ